MTTSMKIVVRLRPRYSDYSGMGRGKKGIVRVLVAGGILRLVLSPLGSFASHRPLTFQKKSKIIFEMMTMATSSPR